MKSAMPGASNAARCRNLSTLAFFKKNLRLWNLCSITPDSRHFPPSPHACSRCCSAPAAAAAPPRLTPVVPDAPSITSQPAAQTIVVGQTATFSVVATGAAPISYQWQKNGVAIGGATSASYTTPAAAAADNGAMFSVVVSNTVGHATSSAAKLSVMATGTATSTDMVTFKNDRLRSGQNLTETLLTLANVNSNSFGLLRNLSVDSNVDAQPLYLSKLADRRQRAQCRIRRDRERLGVRLRRRHRRHLWHVSLLGPQESTSDTHGCGQVTPSIGITSTPVIDRAAGAHGVIYVVAMSKDTRRQLPPAPACAGCHDRRGAVRRPDGDHRDLSRDRRRRVATIRAGAVRGARGAAAVERHRLYELDLALRQPAVSRLDHGLQPDDAGAERACSTSRPTAAARGRRSGWRAAGPARGQRRQHLSADRERRLRDHAGRERLSQQAGLRQLVPEAPPPAPR